MHKPQLQTGRGYGEERRISGDPGVGGLLSDPLQESGPHDEPDPAAGPPSPAPEPPRHHGDWMPTHRAAARMAASARLAAIARRKSMGGMPRALFREDDGTDLEDLRQLAGAAHHRVSGMSGGLRQER